MDENELRKLCAEEAMKYINNNSIIGLGAGRNIVCLIEYLGEAVKNGLKIKIVTPSYSTQKLCLEYGFEVLPLCFTENVDVAFDGCGEIDKNFYASKGGGGVHTQEKLVAVMSKEYIILADEKKLTKHLNSKYPISLEVIKDSLSYVKKITTKLGGMPVVRTSSNKEGYTVTDDGNFLLDVEFKNIVDYKKLNEDLNKIQGVVGTSLFTEEVTRIIIARENGVEVLSRV